MFGYSLDPLRFEKIAKVHFNRLILERNGYARQHFEIESQETLLHSSRDTQMMPDSSMVTYKRSQCSRTDLTCVSRISISKLCLVKPFLCNFDLLKWIFAIFSKRKGSREQPSMQRRLIVTIHHSCIVESWMYCQFFDCQFKMLGNSANCLQNSLKPTEKIENVEFFAKSGATITPRHFIWLLCHSFCI